MQGKKVLIVAMYVLKLWTFLTRKVRRPPLLQQVRGSRVAKAVVRLSFVSLPVSVCRVGACIFSIWLRGMAGTNP